MNNNNILPSDFDGTSYFQIPLVIFQAIKAKMTNKETGEVVEVNLNPSHKIIYTYLMHTYQMRQRDEKFVDYSDDHMSKFCGISRSTFIRNREDLESLNLIEKIYGKKGGKTAWAVNTWFHVEFIKSPDELNPARLLDYEEQKAKRLAYKPGSPNKKTKRPVRDKVQLSTKEPTPKTTSLPPPSESTEHFSDDLLLANIPKDIIYLAFTMPGQITPEYIKILESLDARTTTLEGFIEKKHTQQELSIVKRLGTMAAAYAKSTGRQLKSFHYPPKEVESTIEDTQEELYTYL